MDRGTWRVTGHSVTKSWTQLKQLSTRTYMLLSPTRSTDGFLGLIKLTLAAIFLAVVFLLGCLYDPPLNPKHCLSKYVLSQF